MEKKGSFDWLIKLVYFVVFIPLQVILLLCKDSKKNPYR